METAPRRGERRARAATADADAGASPGRATGPPLDAAATRRAAKALLDWYDRERRDLPWRAAPGHRADPYAVWLSEIMLQQTTVKAVIPYFARFLARWPTVSHLAAADLDDVLAAWAGLGYYARARNLHKCAQVVAREHGGSFPGSEAELSTLPGVGPYTAAAVAAIAFDRHATPVDGNIERVTARVFAVETLLPAAKPELRRLAATMTPDRRAGDHAQALMDLGAAICTPRRPSCLMCPLAAVCRARLQGIADTLPRRAQKPERPERFGTAFLALSEDGHVLLRQRPDTGLLASMLEVPSTVWGDALPRADKALEQAPVNADWWRVPTPVEHTFTHFRLELTVYRALVPRDAPLTLWADGPRCRWLPRGKLPEAALPSVMRKVIAEGFATLNEHTPRHRRGRA